MAVQNRSCSEKDPLSFNTLRYLTFKEQAILEFLCLNLYAFKNKLNSVAFSYPCVRESKSLLISKLS